MTTPSIYQPKQREPGCAELFDKLGKELAA
jgi:hypothetical protein